MTGRVILTVKKRGLTLSHWTLKFLVVYKQCVFLKRNEQTVVIVTIVGDNIYSSAVILTIDFNVDIPTTLSYLGFHQLQSLRS